MVDCSYHLTVGVEEEFHVVDPVTRQVVPDAPLIASRMPPGIVKLELLAGTIETATPVCRSLPELRAELLRLRATASAGASEVGRIIASSGSLPLVDWSRQFVPDDPRYQRLLNDYQQQAREQLISGTHVHVGVDDPELAIAVVARVRPWLSALLALSTSSPYWSGADTGYASWRAQMWRRWPAGGLPEPVGSRAEYDALVATLLRLDLIPDEGMLYWELRPSAKYPTVEFRIADACQTVDETLLQAALSRALVVTAIGEARRGAPLPTVQPMLPGFARFLAARHGLAGDLLDPLAQERLPAARLLDRLLAHVGPALDQVGDRAEVETAVARLLRDGTGADRQRRAASGGMEAVVDLVAAETTADLGAG